MHDEREEKYSKTQKRPPDYGKPDRAGEAIASYYDGGNYLAGEDLPVTLTVTNAGQAASNGVKGQF